MNVRTQDKVVHGKHKLSAVREVLQQEKAHRSLMSLFGHENGTKEQPAAAAAQAISLQARAGMPEEDKINMPSAKGHSMSAWKFLYI